MTWLVQKGAKLFPYLIILQDGLQTWSICLRWNYRQTCLSSLFSGTSLHGHLCSSIASSLWSCFLCQLLLGRVYATDIFIHCPGFLAHSGLRWPISILHFSSNLSLHMGWKCTRSMVNTVDAQTEGPWLESTVTLTNFVCRPIRSFGAQHALFSAIQGCYPRFIIARPTSHPSTLRGSLERRQPCSRLYPMGSTLRRRRWWRLV